MKYHEIAATLATLTSMIVAQDCDLMCAAIYSFDSENCACVEIEWMECHPQYNVECNQAEYDASVNRNPEDNPYIEEDWYPGTIEVDGECDLMCAAIYSFDSENCECVEIEWMECHPQYNNYCNQSDYDASVNRDPAENPYI